MMSLEKLREIEKRLRQEYLALVSKQIRMRVLGNPTRERMAIIREANRVHASLEITRVLIEKRISKLQAK